MRTTLLPFLTIVPCLFAQGGANCQPVGGGVLTNFVESTTTLGSATGDLRGGLGVDVLSVTQGTGGSPTVFHVHHHWVTESGDTISLADAVFTAYPIAAIPGLYAVSYNSGIQVTGGTGRFEGASGLISAYGAVNLNLAQATLRYAGQVCFKPVIAHSIGLQRKKLSGSQTDQASGGGL